MTESRVLPGQHPVVPGRAPVIAEPDILAERALIREAALLHHTGRGRVELVALPVHPVQAERAKAEREQCPEDLRGIAVLPVLRPQDIPDLSGGWLPGIDLQEHKTGKILLPRHPGRKNVTLPVRPGGLCDRVVHEFSDLLLVLEPEEDLLHDSGIAGHAPDTIEIALVYVF